MIWPEFAGLYNSFSALIFRLRTAMCSVASSQRVNYLLTWFYFFCFFLTTYVIISAILLVLNLISSGPWL